MYLLVAHFLIASHRPTFIGCFCGSLCSLAESGCCNRSIAVRSNKKGKGWGLSVLRYLRTSTVRSNGNQRVRISSFVTCLMKMFSPNFNFNVSVGSKFSIRKVAITSTGYKSIFRQFIFSLTRLWSACEGDLYLT